MPNSFAVHAISLGTRPPLNCGDHCISARGVLSKSIPTAPAPQSPAESPLAGIAAGGASVLSRATLPAIPASRGKRIALLACTVAILALVGAVGAVKAKLREQWSIRRLSSEDE